MGTTALALQLLITLTDQLGKISTILSKAHAEGREVSDTELDTLAAEGSAIRAALQAEIDQQKAKGL